MSLIFHRGDLSIRDVTVRVGAEVNTATSIEKTAKLPTACQWGKLESHVHVQFREVAARILGRDSEQLCNHL